MAIGYVTLAVAKAEANAANLYIAQHRPTLIDRMSGSAKTVADALDAMPISEVANTAKSTRSLDKRIRAAMGKTRLSDVTVMDCAELLDSLIAEGKSRQAEALRTRLRMVMRKAQAKGWITHNPADITERPKVEVQRDRLTLEQWRKIHAAAPQVNEWLQHALLLALVTAQDRSTIASMKRSDVKDDCLIVWRSKTRKTAQPVAIPLRLRLDAVNVSISDLISYRSGVVSPFLLHHVQPHGNAPRGAPIALGTISKAFKLAKELAGVESSATFHECRSLSLRLYEDQGGVDTKALAGHATDRMHALYQDARGIEPVRVRVG